MRAARIGLNVGSIVLAAVLGWLVVRIALGLLDPDSLRTPNPIVAPAAAAETTLVRNYEFSHDPFNLGEVAIEIDDFVADVPETTLDLALKGITSGSGAIFRLPDNSDKSVDLGEDVMDGVTLMRTEKNFVMLDVNGEAQRLTLERVKLEANADKTVISRATPSTATVTPSRAQAEDLFKKVQLIPSIGMNPDRSTRRKGYLIKARNGADLSEFGLQDGDIVTRIGPVLLTVNRVNIKELREMLATGAAQDIEILRDDTPLTIRIGQ